jgi:hypothetical protein
LVDLFLFMFCLRFCCVDKSNFCMSSKKCWFYP